MYLVGVAVKFFAGKSLFRFHSSFLLLHCIFSIVHLLNTMSIA